MTARLEIKICPSETDRSAILKPLRAYNSAQAGDPQAESVAILVRDEHSNEVIGGLWGEIFYRWLFIELLAIPEQTRGQGVGSGLMDKAEQLARDKSCVGIWLDTFSFQAPGFYEKCGFNQFGQLEDFPPGLRRFFYQKRLS